MSVRFEATENKRDQQEDDRHAQNDNHGAHITKAGPLALLFLLIITSAFFAAPFDAMEGTLLLGNPATRPGITLYATGILIGTALNFMPSRRVTNVLRKPKAIPVLCVIIGAALIAPMGIDWLGMIFFSDASQSHGFFGSELFVYIRNLFWIISPVLEILAGYLTSNLLLNEGAVFSGIDKPLHSTMERPKARVLFCWMAIAWGLLARQATAMTYEYAAVPISSLFALIICIGIFALPLIAFRKICRSDQPCHFASSASFPSLLMGSFSIGVIIWGALIRVVHVSTLAHPGFTLLLVAASLSCVLLLIWQAERTIEGIQDDFRDGAALHETRNRLFQEAGLAPREAEIAQLFADGRTSGEIANLLSIKPATVRSALQRAYKKLGVGNKNEFMSLLNSETIATEIKADKPDITDDPAKIDATPKPLPPGWALALIVLVAFACVIPTALDTQAWGAHRPWLYGIALIFVFCGISVMSFLPRNDRRDEVDDVLYAACVAIYLGFAWEETLRLETPYGLADVTSPVLIVIGCMSLASIIARQNSNGNGKRVAITLAVAILALLSCLLWRPSLFVISLCTFCELIYQAWRQSALRPSNVGACIVILGLSAIASDILVNKYGDYIFGNDAWTDPFGGRQAFTMLCVICTIIAGIAAIFACTLLARSIHAHSLASNVNESGLEPDGRVWHYLMGCGLNETQTSVLLMIAKGASSRQISDALGYSRGSINSARHVGYTRLGVRDRLGLVKLLSQVDSL